MLTATSIPLSSVPTQVTEFDKVIHFSIYALFAFLLTRALLQTSTRWRAIAVAFAITVALAAFDEWHQGFVPGRFPDVADWQADCFGGALGAVTAALWRRERTRSTIG